MITVASPFPLLYAALWTASVGAVTRTGCELAVFVLTGMEECGPVLGRMGAAFGLTSATFLAAGAWQFGVPLAVLAAVFVFLRQRERRRGKLDTATGVQGMTSR